MSQRSATDRYTSPEKLVQLRMPRCAGALDHHLQHSLSTDTPAFAVKRQLAVTEVAGGWPIRACQGTSPRP